MLGRRGKRDEYQENCNSMIKYNLRKEITKLSKKQKNRQKYTGALWLHKVLGSEGPCAWALTFCLCHLEILNFISESVFLSGLIGQCSIQWGRGLEAHITHTPTSCHPTKWFLVSLLPPCGPSSQSLDTQTLSGAGCACLRRLGAEHGGTSGG